MKICTKCGLEKDPIEFYKRRASYDGLSFRCKTCCKAFEQTPQGKLIRNRAVRRYQATDRGQAVAVKCEQNRNGTITRKLSHNRANSRYKKTENGHLVSSVHWRARREKQRGLDAQFTKQDILALYARFEHKCFACGTGEDLSIDHHRPLSEGHGLSASNAVLLCIKCNCTKSTKYPEEFYRLEQLEALRGLGVI